jgi:hypothetical protein
MNDENFSQVTGANNKLTKVTPLSRILAMILFVVLPFLGGLVGYHVAPEKVVEVEKIIIKEIDNKQLNIDSTEQKRSTLSKSNDMNVYSNQVYGFQLTLTAKWAKHFVETETGYTYVLTDIEKKDNTRERIKFCLETQFGKECLFAIDVIDSKLIQEYENEVEGCIFEQENTGISMHPCDTEIGRNETYLFLGKVIVQDSSDEGIIALEDVGKIFDSFKLFSGEIKNETSKLNAIDDLNYVNNDFGFSFVYDEG